MSERLHSALILRTLRLFVSLCSHGLAATVAKILRRFGIATGYRRWIRRFESSFSPVAAEGPLFSLVVPLHQTPLRWLRALVRSVQAQTHPNWQLVLVNAGGGNPRLNRELIRLARAESRIQVVDLPSNEGIAENTNAGLAVCEGPWVGFADHDDTLAPFALSAVVETLRRRPDASVFYSDEDKLSPRLGRRILPFLKPDWSPETFLSYNYPCHFLVAKRNLLQQIGGLRSGFNGAQDYDLILRLTEIAPPPVHIPHVLYHWRMTRQSTAGRPEAKTYAYESAKRALNEHFARTGRDASAEGGISLGTYRIRHHSDRRPLVSIVIPNRDQPELLSRCLETLLSGTEYRNFEVLLAENGSTDRRMSEVYTLLQQDPRVRLCPWSSSGEFNYAAVNNDTVRQHARGELVLFLNNDIEITQPDWLEVLVERAVQPGIGAVGPKLVFPDGTLQHGGIVTGIAGFAGHPFKGSRPGASGYYSVLIIDRNVSAVTGACLMVRREVFDAVGGFDPVFPLAGNDVDFCLRLLQAGFRNVYTPFAALVHHESKTRGYEDTPEKQVRFGREKLLFQDRWKSFLEAGDPYYHAGLTLNAEDWSLRR